MYRITDTEFQEAVEKAILSIPEDFRVIIDNVAFVVQDEPTDSQLASVSGNPRRELLGLYSGIALPRRSVHYGIGGPQPDTITIFKGPHERVSFSKEDLTERIRVTVLHEVGHYFGMNEQQLRDAGY